MKAQEKTARARLTLEMPQATRDLMADLQARTGAVSVAEVIRRAMALYDVVAREIQSGSKLVVRSGDGVEREVIFL